MEESHAETEESMTIVLGCLHIFHDPTNTFSHKFTTDGFTHEQARTLPRPADWPCFATPCLAGLTSSITKFSCATKTDTVRIVRLQCLGISTTKRSQRLRVLHKYHGITAIPSNMMWD